MQTKLKYWHPKHELNSDGFDFDLHRRLMCEYIGNFEGTELGDGISNLCHAVSNLGGIGCDHEAQIALLLAEKLCREYVEYLRKGNAPDEYDEISIEVFKHFTGGANKIKDGKIVE